MSARVATQAEQMPRRARYLVPKGLPRRGEFLAACVVVVVLAHVLFAQLTIVLAVVFALTTRATRWRLSWLLVPVVTGVAWTLAAGPRAAAAGFAAGPAKVAAYLGASGYQLDHVLHFTGAFTGIGSWLPRQLPLAIVTGAAEAAIIGWLSWLHTDEISMPPGPSRSAGRRPACRDQAGHPGRRRRDQGRELPRGGGRVRFPDHAVLAGGGRRGVRVRLGRTGRAEHQLPAGPRRGAAAQAGGRGGPDRRPGPAGAAGRGLRRGGRAAAGVRRGRLLRAVPARRPRPAGLAHHRHGQLGRAGQPVPAELRGLPAGRLRADRRRAGRPPGTRAGRGHPPAEPDGHAGPDGARPGQLPAPRGAGRADAGIGEPAARRAGHHRRARPAAARAQGVGVRPLAAPVRPGSGGRDRPRPDRHRPGRGPVPAGRFAVAGRLGHAHPAGLPGPAHRGRGAARDRRRRRRDRVAGRVRLDAAQFGHRAHRPRPGRRPAGARGDHLRAGRGRTRGAHQRGGGPPDGGPGHAAQPRRPVRAAGGRVPAHGQEPAAAGAARGLRPGPDPVARARRGARDDLRPGRPPAPGLAVRDARIRIRDRRRAGPPRRSTNGSTPTGPRPSGARRTCSTGR